MVNWLLNEYCEIKKNKLKWLKQGIRLAKLDGIPEVPIETINIRCYVPSSEIIRSGLNEKSLQKKLKKDLLKTKPFLIKSDVILPFSCPSIIIGVDHPEKKSLQVPHFTYYGDIPREKVFLCKLSPLTKMKIDFFSFPLFNRKFPVILDTSAIDISRFPLSAVGSFFEAYLEGRVLIIPNAALHEIKTRLRTGDRAKVQKALVRLTKMLSWGVIKGIKFEGELPDLSVTTKEDIEDLRDCMILDLTRKTGGILFSNDQNLVKLAILTGVYPISFSGLEEDVMRIIKENDLRLTKEQVVDKVKDYGNEERLKIYRNEDIEWMIEQLCTSNKICFQKLDKKEVLQYQGHRHQSHKK